ncbi:DLA class II histocompatibility antigen, DR-1 beta chain-like, partial [Sceloporus undulatus]|uniref:DLA class II histocompatibility antigen, DR-1 beta chain-like n=1 Tax=Sceloporus undulatus TaxID=8520 RepID=UPI001C4BD63C
TEGHFLLQSTSECSFTSNGTGPEEKEGGPSGVRFVQRYIYDRQEYVRFDSDWGEFRAISLLGEPSASDWNSQKEALEYERSQVDVFCRHNYRNYAAFARSRRIQPRLQITPIEHETSSGHTVLICDVDGFWPAEIEVKWFRNGKEEEGPQVMTTDLIRNGDWTFQIQVMLETKPERGDVYACQVDHASFTSPARVQW